MNVTNFPKKKSFFESFLVKKAWTKPLSSASIRVMEKSLLTSEEPLRYCLYARKSSEADERQALSIESQLNEMTKLAEKEGIKIVETIKESKSAKESGLRTGYNQVLQGLNEGRFNAILTWAPDRLSRNAGDLGRLVDLMDQGILQQIQTSGQTFTNTPDEKFLLMILCSQAKLENDNRAKNVKRGLRAKCEKGARPGRTPLGYKLIRSQNFNEPSQIEIDEERAPFIKRAFEYVAKENLSGRQVHEYLTDEGFRSLSGKQLSLSMVYRLLKEPFYYGEFLYGGAYYQGSHKPIISKEIFDLAQENLKTSEKGKWGRKEFYFSRLFKCGTCGSGVSGAEHINRHGKLYVYYKCNKYGGTRRCNEKYIREEKLIISISEIVDQFKDNHFRLQKSILHEVEKMNRIQKQLSGGNAREFTSKEYIEDILKNGSKPEKREILSCLKETLFLQGGEIYIGNNNPISNECRR